MPKFEAEIAAEADVKESEVHKIVWQGRPILLFRREDRKIYAYVDVCPHVGGPVAMKNGALVCQWHASKFDPLTGKTTKGPAPPDSELTPLPIEVRNGKVYYVYPPDKPRGEWHISSSVGN